MIVRSFFNERFAQLRDGFVKHSHRPRETPHFLGIVGEPTLRSSYEIAIELHHLELLARETLGIEATPHGEQVPDEQKDHKEKDRDHVGIGFRLSHSTSPETTVDVEPHALRYASRDLFPST